MRWWLEIPLAGVCLLVGERGGRPARAEVPTLPAIYAQLFDQQHRWSYDVSTTTYDISDFRKARPPKRTSHVTVTCQVTMVTAFAHGAASRVTCDGEIDPELTIAGDYGATDEGLFRVASFPASEADIAAGTQLIAARPRAWRRADHDVVRGLRATGHAWCVFDDERHTDSGATKSFCFEPNVGIASGTFEGGEDWRKVSYRIKSTLAKR